MTPEPLLEMTGSDLAWLKRNLAPVTLRTNVEHGLFMLLLRVEAGRRQAIFRIQHPMERCVERRDLWERSKDMARCNDPRHNWTPADWLAEVEREVKGGK